MADANGADLTAFKPWYSQAGTPKLDVTTEYDAAAKTFTMTCTQSTPTTPGQSDKKPVLMPIAVGLLASDGSDMELTLEGEAGTAGETTKVLRLSERLKLSCSPTSRKSRCRRSSATSARPSGSAPTSPRRTSSSSWPTTRTSSTAGKPARPSPARFSSTSWKRRARERGSARPHGPGDRRRHAHPIVNLAKEAGADKAFIARAMALPSEGELSEMVVPRQPRRHPRGSRFRRQDPRQGAQGGAPVDHEGQHVGKVRARRRVRAARTLKNTCLALLSYLEDPEIDAEAFAGSRRPIT